MTDLVAKAAETLEDRDTLGEVFFGRSIGVPVALRLVVSLVGHVLLAACVVCHVDCLK